MTGRRVRPLLGRGDKRVSEVVKIIIITLLSIKHYCNIISLLDMVCSSSVRDFKSVFL